MATAVALAMVVAGPGVFRRTVATAAAADDETSESDETTTPDAAPGDYGGKRVESEISIHVPDGMEDEVWGYLSSVYGSDRKASWPAELDTRWLSARLSDERFVDRYFDTADLKLLSADSGVRHRARDIPGAPGDPKDDRELVQVKVTADGDTVRRGEMKFAVRRSKQGKQGRRLGPLELVTKKQRPQLVKLLASMGIAPSDLRQVLRIEQRRRRVYFSDAEGAVATVTMDQSTARRWWAQAPWTEIEVELGEVRYTQSAPEERRRLDGLQAALRADLLRRFPALHEDNRPKYSEAYDRLDQELPLMRQTIAASAALRPAAPVAMAVALSGVLLGTGIFAARRLRGRWRPA